MLKMSESTPVMGDGNIPRLERRKPDPSTIQAWEALHATEAELIATKTRLASLDEALAASRLREERLLGLLEKRQVRMPHLVLTVAATAVITVVLTLIAVRYTDGLGFAGNARTAVVQQDLAPAERYQR